MFKASVFIGNLVHGHLYKLYQLLQSVHFMQYSVTGYSLRGYLEWSIQHPQQPGGHLGHIVLFFMYLFIASFAHCLII